VILNAKHLKRTLTKYFRYYHESRTHLGLGKQCPIPRSVSSSGKIIEFRYLAGYITAMNALPHNDMAADAFLANDNFFGRVDAKMILETNVSECKPGS
jgi:hypothetical protein